MLNSSRLVNGYIVEYKEANSGQWLSIKSSAEDCVFSLGSLTHDTSYVLRISTEFGEGAISDPSEELLITTKRDWMKIIEDTHESYSFLSAGPPSVYTLNLKRVGTGEFSKLSFEIPSLLDQETKTIMLFGAPGSGKTALINGMINYILGVDWEDDCRFKLISEVASKTQGESKTEKVTACYIHHMKGFQIPYSLTIIDIPEFGDMRGILQDKDITKQIHSFLCHQDDFVSIDAVCFVVQSSLTCPTSTKKYIFDSIFSLIGKDIKNNIFTLITFADGEIPSVHEDLKFADICCAELKDGSPLHFKFCAWIVCKKQKRQNEIEVLNYML
uniref:Fibronectin type-III domain-containing protein n=1 Tax=Electrophorus electricus TaxID=8005 RepID=A0A4W4GD48_ELEEL